MAIATANDIIQQAFQNLLGINVSATMPTADISNALDVLNAMMDNLSADGLLTIGQVRESFPLVYNQQAYTIGSSGNFNTAKPINISSCFVRDSNNNAYRMQVGTREIWDGLSDKDLSALVGIPELLFYDPGLTQQATQVGTIYIYPTPDASTTYTLFLESEKMLTEFSSLSTSINMPLYYKEMLVYQLMLRLPCMAVRFTPICEISQIRRCTELWRLMQGTRRSG